MKRVKLFLIVAIVAVIVFSATGAFAQTTISVMELNGWDWIMFTDEEQFAFAVGYLLAMDTQRDKTQNMYEFERSLTKNQYNFLYNFFTFGGTDVNLVDKVNAYYAETAQFDHLLWQVIVYQYGKTGWWANK